MPHIVRLTILVLPSTTNSPVITQVSYCLARQRSLVEWCLVSSASDLSQQKIFGGQGVDIAVGIHDGDVTVLSKTFL